MIFYTYFLKWSSTNMKYYGARGCNCAPEDDFWVKYFTSSKYVKQYRKLHGDPDTIEIRKIFDSKDIAFNWERRVLVKTGSKKSDQWLNRYDMNYHGSYGPKNHGDKVSKALKDKPKSIEHRTSLSKSIEGSKWINNGVIQKQMSSKKILNFLIENPDFTYGMLPFGEEQRKNQSITRKKLIEEGKIVMPSNTGGTSWNKGLTIETSLKLKENGEKISKAKKGKTPLVPPWNTGKTYKTGPREYKNLWYTNGTVNIQIREGNDHMIPEGYSRGRTTGWNTSKQVRLDKNKANSLSELK